MKNILAGWFSSTDDRPRDADYQTWNFSRVMTHLTKVSLGGNANLLLDFLASTMILSSLITDPRTVSTEAFASWTEQLEYRVKNNNNNNKKTSSYNLLNRKQCSNRI